MNRGKIIVIFLIILCFIAIQDFIFNGPDEVIGNFFDKFTYAQENDYDIDKLKTKNIEGNISKDGGTLKGINVINNNGDVRIEGTNDNKISIDYKITMSAIDEERAEKYLKKISITEDIKNNTLNILLKEPKIRDEFVKDIKVTYNIKIPESLYAKVSNNNGNFIAENIVGDLKAEVSNATFKNIKGNLDIHSDYGSHLEIINISGNLKVNSGNNDLYIADAKGNIEVNQYSGDVLLENTQGDIVISGEDGNIEIINHSGNLDTNIRFGMIRVENISGPVRIEQEGDEGPPCDVQFFNVNDNVDVSLNYGNIRVNVPDDDKGCKINVAVRDGNVRTRLPLSFVETDEGVKRASGSLGNGEYTINLKTTGNVYIRK